MPCLVLPTRQTTCIGPNMLQSCFACTHALTAHSSYEPCEDQKENDLATKKVSDAWAGLFGIMSNYILSWAIFALNASNVHQNRSQDVLPIARIHALFCRMHNHCESLFWETWRLATNGRGHEHVSIWTCIQRVGHGSCIAKHTCGI